MRIVKEDQYQGVNITYFQLDHKFMVKYEMGPQELTYKFKIGDKLNTPAELDVFAKEHLHDRGIKVLRHMLDERQAAIEAYFVEEDEFDEII